MIKRKLYIGIDDTDEIGYELSTGRICERIREGLPERHNIKAEPVTRHQLLLHEAIPYTSHNSAMCFAVVIDPEQRRAVESDIIEQVRQLAAPASSPGICTGFAHDITDTDALVGYGFRAKRQVLTKEEAYGMAARQNIFMIGLKHGGNGVIGALAGIGLRFSGKDGKIRGRLRIDGDRHTAGELLENGLIDRICLSDGTPVSENATIETPHELKAIYRDSLRVLLVEPCGSDGYRPLDRERLLEL